ncbi:Uncharacterised protein [Legionella donaldsonii]|uniref:HEAT repeat domain-containing protein n=1 Tax=Legionella donaldsonii TaxID=45060 RepID=A0A378J2B2_9GAMM|nr:HEAT repeat domain-containing protein [Legionella donaldsonii]STX41047.1 Uncharacterised protein [Legionella donaldsonii]
MKRVFILTLTLLCSFTIEANNIVDIYGLDEKQSEKIIKKYANRVAIIEGLLLHRRREKNNDSNLDNLLFKKRALLNEIKNEGRFLYVDFNTIFYPGNKNQYTTIEVVQKDQPERLRYINTEYAKNYKLKDDLINEMITFSNLEFELMINNQLNLKESSCPVYHCISGFHHPKLKPYLKIFNTGAIKEKTFIIKTLNDDPDPSRRAAAAFLLGHFKDPHEIISLLMLHVNDRDSGVRNNVMRVIAATMFRAKIDHIDVLPFLDLLASPETTDRNKALGILAKAADSQDEKKIIIQKGGENLLAILKLKQPNNHDIAYLILKKISGKDFGDTNLAAWKKWLESAQIGLA